MGSRVKAVVLKLKTHDAEKISMHLAVCAAPTALGNLLFAYPALTRWANLWRTSGAEEFFWRSSKEWPDSWHHG